MPTARRPIGMVFQHYALFPNMTVRNNVGFPLLVRHTTSAEVRRRVDELLDLVQLRDQAERYPNQIGGRCALPSSTYPGFATLLTRQLPPVHGVRTTNWHAGAVPGWAGERAVRVATLFDRCGAAGLRSVAVLGDHLLHGVLRTESATRRWPACGIPGAGVALDAHGYAQNSAVLPPLVEQVVDDEIDFVFGHLNEADTWGHEYGPRHGLTQECYMATDWAVGVVVAALQSAWRRTVLIVVSDLAWTVDRHAADRPHAARRRLHRVGRA